MSETDWPDYVDRSGKNEDELEGWTAEEPDPLEVVDTCDECGSPMRFNKYGARWDCSNYGACENAGG